MYVYMLYVSSFVYLSDGVILSRTFFIIFTYFLVRPSLSIRQILLETLSFQKGECLRMILKSSCFVQLTNFYFINP